MIMLDAFWVVALIIFGVVCFLSGFFFRKRFWPQEIEYEDLY